MRPEREVRYPGVEVRLSGTDSNAYAVLGRVSQALREAGAATVDQEAFLEEATAGDYDHLLQTCMRWVDVS